jgi:capsid protein
VRRPSQYTGVPWGATALIDARDLADYDGAALLKQKLAACFAGFVTDTDLEADRTGDVLTETIEPGLIQRLSPGQSIVFPDPPKVDNDKEFRAYYLRKVAVAYGISYEALTGDMSEVNFSSGRMGWLEMARNIARWRWNIMVPQFLDPVAAWYQQMAKVSYRTASRVPSGRMQWTPPLREMINPVEEIKWLAEAVRAGFMTLSEVQRSFGYVPSDLLDELASDLEAARKRGLALSVDGTMDVGRLQATAFADQNSAGPQPADPEPADPETTSPPPVEPATAG